MAPSHVGGDIQVFSFDDGRLAFVKASSCGGLELQGFLMGFGGGRLFCGSCRGLHSACSFLWGRWNGRRRGCGRFRRGGLDGSVLAKKSAGRAGVEEVV